MSAKSSLMCCALVCLVPACSREASSAEGAAVTVAKVSLHLRSRTEPVTEPVRRQDQPELELELHLTNAPRGSTLSLACAWRAAEGQTVYHNAWNTRAIDHEPWPTHCRHSFEHDAPLGTWTVVMTQAGRELGRASFVLE